MSKYPKMLITQTIFTKWKLAYHLDNEKKEKKEIKWKNTIRN